MLKILSLHRFVVDGCRDDACTSLQVVNVGLFGFPVETGHATSLQQHRPESTPIRFELQMYEIDLSGQYIY